MSKTRPKIQAKSVVNPWPMVRLGDVCEIEFGTRVRRKDSRGGDYPVYGGGGATFCWDTYNRENQCIVSRFAMSEECVRFVRGKFFLNDSGLSVRSGITKLSQTYLDWALYSKQPDIYALGRGAAQKNLDVEQFADMEIPLPPLVEQKEIVTRLERELAAVEKMKKGFEALAETAKAEFKAELKEVFEELKHRGTETRRLGELAKVSYGFTAKASPDIGDGSPKYLRITDIQGRSVEWGSVPVCNCSDLETYRLKEGDIVFARTGATTGKSFLITGDIPLSVYASYLIRVQIVNFKTINPWFLWYSFDTPDYWALIQSGMVGAAQGGFNSKKLASIEIPIPPLSEQRKVVARLDVAKARAEKLEAKAREGVAVCETMRKAILKEAFE